MCSLPRAGRPATAAPFQPDREFLTWFCSARCVTALYYCRGDEEAIACPECKSAKPPAEKERYQGVITHYLHFGNSFNPKRCDLCRVSLASAHNIRDCHLCPRTVEEFVVQLITSGDYPWLNTEPTIVVHSRSAL